MKKYQLLLLQGNPILRIFKVLQKANILQDHENTITLPGVYQGF